MKVSDAKNELMDPRVRQRAGSKKQSSSGTFNRQIFGAFGERTANGRNGGVKSEHAKDLQGF
jgi:hypothetical protein